MVKIIFFNGPPRCGKDTAVDRLAQTHKWVMPIKIAQFLHWYGEDFLDALGLPEDDIERYSKVDKDEPLPVVNVSYRQLLINLSEKHFKPEYGKDIFGRMTAERVKELMQYDEDFEMETVVAISDSGFDYEAFPLISLVGAENCLLVRVHREGHDFSKDSRSYVDLSAYGVRSIDVNNTTLNDYFDKVEDAYKLLVA